MKILIACEFSGIVRDAFIKQGHDAVSCDLLPSERPGPHIQGDVLEHLNDGWDMMIAFPPCTHLAVSGARWFREKQLEQIKAIAFFAELVTSDIPMWCIENPIGIMSTKYRKPDQIIQPWQFGHGEVKATCLWLKGLPKLIPTDIVEGREARVHRMPPGPNRWKERSRTFQGIADAMASQWSNTPPKASDGLRQSKGCQTTGTDSIMSRSFDNSGQVSPIAKCRAVPPVAGKGEVEVSCEICGSTQGTTISFSGIAICGNCKRMV